MPGSTSVSLKCFTCLLRDYSTTDAFKRETLRVQACVRLSPKPLREHLVHSAEDPNVAGFKSVVCYRTGLDVSTVSDPSAEVEALYGANENFRSRTDVALRLASKLLNDLVVRTTLEVAAEFSKPGIILPSLSLPHFLMFFASRSSVPYRSW